MYTYVNSLLVWNSIRMPSERLHWVDFVKTINILGVVWIHVHRGMLNAGIYELDSSTHWISRFLGAFIMPGFFFLSGMFVASSARRPFKEFLGEKTRTLVYIYFLWVTIHCSIQILMGGFTNRQKNWSVLWENFYHPVDHFWFIYTMFFVMMTFYLFKKLGLGPLVFLIFSVGLYGTHFIGEGNVGPWGLIYLMRDSMLFFGLGAVVNRKGPILWINASPTWRVAALGLSGYGITFFLVMQGYRDDLLINPLLFFPGITGTICFAILMHRSGNFGWIEICGRNSIAIYVAHVIGLAGVRIVLQKGLGIDAWQIHAPLGVLGGVCVPLTLVWFSKRFDFPYLLAWPKKVDAPLKTAEAQ
jgi:uncharacterized membrane protein YcfT